MKSCETGRIVYRPYPRRLERKSNHLQMSLHRQHFHTVMICDSVSGAGLVIKVAQDIAQRWKKLF